MEANTPLLDVMWSISRIAEHHKVSKPTVSAHVKRLVERHNLTVIRDHRGRVVRVNVVDYDRLRERYADPSKAQAPQSDRDEGADGTNFPRSTSTSRPASDSYDEALRRKAWFEVERRRLEIGELRGQLIRADRHAVAIDRLGAELVRMIDRLPQEADAVAAELDFDDVHRVRIAIKGLARRLRVDLSKAFGVLRDEAPAFDEPIADIEDGGSDTG